jgi:hypothetical protein
MPNLSNNFSFYQSSFTQEKDLAAGKSSNHYVQVCINYMALAHNEMCIVLWDLFFVSIFFQLQRLQRTDYDIKRSWISK